MSKKIVKKKKAKKNAVKFLILQAHHRGTAQKQQRKQMESEWSKNFAKFVKVLEKLEKEIYKAGKIGFSCVLNEEKKGGIVTQMSSTGPVHLRTFGLHQLQDVAMQRNTGQH